MKGYKAFNKDLTCRKFQFEIGKTYEHSGELSLCNSGFHFCTKLADCFSYYIFSDKPIICEVEILGKVLTDSQRDSKACTDKIKIIRKLSWDEVLNLSNSGYNNSGYNNSGNYNSGNYNSGDYNSGHYNSGYRNSGHYNSGNRNSGNYNSGDYNSGHYNSGYRNSGNYNSGDYNSGDYNSGYRNSGNYNSGYRNSGDYNSGDYNSGDYNSGYRNSGNYNSGDYNSGYRNSGNYNSGNYNSGNYNSGNCNSGFFNTNNPKLRLFNKETNYESSNEIYNKLQKLQKYSKPILIWVSENKMTDQEKKDNPKYETTKGYLKYTGKQKWDKLSKEDEDWLTSLPEFDSDIFFELTGLKLEKK